jgi:[CysO sulfur-carrier protein]-S-L-cysteine hydrolase
VLQLTRPLWLEMVAHAYDGLPDEACGLLVGELATGSVKAFEPCRNAAASSRVYEIDGRDYLRVDREAEGRGLDIVGVMHSHTHTEAYPSPTDVGQAVDPAWHYIIVSLKRAEPALRSFLIADGKIEEETVTVTPG